MNTTQTATARNDHGRHGSFLAQATTPSTRRELRTREFGIGYGNSSGYATTRRYATTASEGRFRFA